MRTAARVKPSKAELVTPLTILEEYAKEDLIRQAEDFLAMLERVAAGWGIEHERQVALIIAESHAVTDAASYARVGERIRTAADRDKQILALFEDRKSLFYRAHQIVCRRESSIFGPLRLWMQQAKTNWEAFQREDERKRREEEQRLQDEARRQEQDRLQKEAEHAEQRGEPELAKMILEEAVVVPTPVITIASTLPTTKGISSRPNWKWRPIGGDTPANRARAEQLAPREVMELSDRKLTAIAKAHQGTKRIPGIEFYDAGTVSVRS